MAKKTNWDKLSKLDNSDRTQFRDVYEDQQLDRSKIGDKQSFTSRLVGAILLSVLAMILIYLVGMGVSFAKAYYDLAQDRKVVKQYNLSINKLEEFIKDSNKYDEDVYKQAIETIDKVRVGYKKLADRLESKYKSVYKHNKQTVESNSKAVSNNQNLSLDDADKFLFLKNYEIKYGYFAAPTPLRLLLMIALGLGLFSVLHQVFKKNLDAQNLMFTTDDINQYANDQHIMLPEEMFGFFDFAPDVGAHFPAEMSSMISHVMLSNKGVNKIKMSKRYTKDVLDQDGEIEYYKGEIMRDEDGDVLFESVDLFDKDFAEALFDASGMPKDKAIRKYYDASKIAYNPGNKNRDKTKDCDYLADLINNKWTFPEYEPQRPAGAYVIDTAPVNTMVLAITRAGKGQTVIEPTIDMWTREQNPNNMVVNDPKGELLVKNYVKGTVRGFQIVQFNLINAAKTDIYNPMGLAADAAREGDFKNCAQYVENIATVFFPVDGGDDPVWPNAANNAFKRAAYGLIDYYLEKETALRNFAARTGMDDVVLENQLDAMWGRVTLFNTYQLFVQLTAKKLKNPLTELQEQLKSEAITQETYDILVDEKSAQAVLWEDKPDTDLLTLFFNATSALPLNGMRSLVNNANSALKSMAGAEKMMASVYGIAITAMSFFTDPTISTLTSGTPAQNTDLGGMSFPRRLGVRFNLDFMKRYHLMGMQARWMSYQDKEFTKPMGKDFAHEDSVTREGWARYYFKGKYPNNTAYIMLEIINPQTNMLIKKFYFEFKKAYQTSLDSRYYIKDPVLNQKIVKNGSLVELIENTSGKGAKFIKGKQTFDQDKLVNNQIQEVRTNALSRTMVRYSECPKMVFLVTPPHLMKYAQLILILIKQLVDLNFDKSYMTKSNQKPLYKTRFMLDELGNLQSDGHGIANFETMLSIGLGQEQQFTLILQTLQQLKDVYGDSVDKVVQGNTSNIVFLKSTDDSMLDTLQKMSGTTHKSFKDSKTVTKNVDSLIMQTEGKVSYTMSTKEVPVISYNDMAFIPERNSIVFSAGNSPIWNRNETILPMSFRLFMNTIVQPGKEYSLQTIPTLSSAMDFDVRKNQPDFVSIVNERLEQASMIDACMADYKKAYDYTEYDIAQLDPDIYSAEVMDMLTTRLREKHGLKPDQFEQSKDDAFEAMCEENTEVLNEVERRGQ